MLKKARQKKHGRHPTILSRWYASESYRNSLNAIGWREKHKMLYDRIALEKHIYVATRAEKIRNSKHWILTLNAEGPQQPLNQRPDFTQAERECKRLHDEHQARTQEEYIPRSQQVRQRKGQQIEGNEEYDIAVDPKTGWRFYDIFVRIAGHHRRQRGTKPSGRRAIGILSILQALTTRIFLRVRTGFGCLEKNLQPTDGGCEQYTHKFSTCRVAQHDHISSREHAWLKMRTACHVSLALVCDVGQKPPKLAHLLVLAFSSTTKHFIRISCPLSPSLHPLSRLHTRPPIPSHTTPHHTQHHTTRTPHVHHTHTPHVHHTHTPHTHHHTHHTHHTGLRFKPRGLVVHRFVSCSVVFALTFLVNRFRWQPQQMALLRAACVVGRGLARGASVANELKPGCGSGWCVTPQSLWLIVVDRTLAASQSV